MAALELLQAIQARDRRMVEEILGHPGVSVPLLLNTTIDVQTGYYPLHVAAELGHTEIIRLLILKGARTDRRAGQYGMTALHIAAESGHAGAVRCLLDEGKADPLCLDDHERVALDLVESHATDVKIILLVGGID